MVFLRIRKLVAPPPLRAARSRMAPAMRPLPGRPRRAAALAAAGKDARAASGRSLPAPRGPAASTSRGQPPDRRPDDRDTTRTLAGAQPGVTIDGKGHLLQMGTTQVDQDSALL